MNGKGLLGKLDATDAQVEEAAKAAEINDFIFLINTSLTGKASHNVAFYTQVLGMRLTKKTVNQDDVSAYHLFYGDELGRPGTDLTFFEWPVRCFVGTGGVHHVAFCTPNEEEHQQWRDRIAQVNPTVTPVIDRFYFRSIYFREPAGVLFEIATDGPGFAVDEDAATLGERLSLPPFLESERQFIEAHLKPIVPVELTARA